MPEPPTASIVIPTRARPEYLDVTLRSIVPQAQEVGAEVLVVTDGSEPASAAVARRHGARLVELPHPAGANAARNAGVAAAASPELIAFLDDDVDAPPGWLGALIDGVNGNPGVDVFGGPIRARLEGGGPRACGREKAPITTLYAGDRDRDVDLVWSANMAVRRRALAMVGPFDERVKLRGEEEEWQRRYKTAGGRVRYIAAAGLDHRRTAADSRLLPLARAAYHQGRSARRYDVRKGSSVRIEGELRVLAGCLWHTVRRRCANGLVMAAHSSGRVVETLAPATPTPPPPPYDFLSGTSGHISGRRLTTQAVLADAAMDALAVVRGERAWLRRAAAIQPPRRRVLALSIERAGVPNLIGQARAELARSRHQVDFHVREAGEQGKFENLRVLLAEHPAAGYDWLLVIDDDVALPRGYLDEFLFLAERFSLTLAQPAHRRRSHAACAVTRRRARSLVRETAFVEIGPVFALRSDGFGALLPFPPLRVGWGLDCHWSALARSHGFHQGVIDATPVRHGLRQIAAAYDRTGAIEEGRAFLRHRDYVPAAEAQRTLAVHRSWRGHDSSRPRVRAV
jgi:GT2 family glycosyltransferase